VGNLGTPYLIPVEGYVPLVLGFGGLLSNVCMFSVLHPKSLGIKPEITYYAVAASRISYSLWLIIDAVCMQTRKKAGKKQNTEHRTQETGYRIL
jgi:hypothetical protein